MSAVERVRAAYARIAEVDRPEVWITLVREVDALRAAQQVDERVAAGEPLPLAGLTLAVKDNVDVAGLRTTAACPSYAYVPGETAPAVRALVEAGAVVLGKTNLDQFATGLVGTRSPYGAVRHATDPTRVSGGSSSGSAVAVALGIADIGIGTDTAGSGRVPAAFHGIVGLKTTVGIVPTTGVVPACRSYDVLTTFTRDLDLGVRATRLMAAGGRRAWPADARVGLRADPVVVVPRDEDLAPLSPTWRTAFAEAVTAVRDAGARIVEADVSPLLDAATLLYDGALVAARYAAVGAFLEEGTDDVDPVVGVIIRGGKDIPAHAYVADVERLERAQEAAARILTGADLLLLPTTTEHPTLADVAADPVGINRRMGTYTNFVNLLDLAALAVPAGEADGLPFGVTVVARAFDDQLAIDLAARLAGGPDAVAPVLVEGGVELAVFGAHLRGQPLNGQLEELGARFVRDVRTSGAYRLVDLGTTPAKPGLVRVGPGAGSGIAGELWHLSEGALGTLLGGLPHPMMLGRVELEDGRWVVGFGCSHDAAESGDDITAHGGWAGYLAAV